MTSKFSVISLFDLFNKEGSRRLVEILYSRIVNPVHELCLREVQPVRRWRGTLLVWSFGRVSALKSFVFTHIKYYLYLIVIQSNINVYFSQSRELLNNGEGTELYLTQH
jgi:hypothetical protein